MSDAQTEATSLKRLGDIAASLHLHQVLPSIANAHPAVRNMAVVCLGTCTLHSKELAKNHMVLLLQVCLCVLST